MQLVGNWVGQMDDELAGKLAELMAAWKVAQMVVE